MTLFRVYVGNLATDVTEDDLREVFEKCGNIHSVFLKKNEDSSIFGFVRFNNLQSMSQAISELNNWPLKGKKLFLQIGHETREHLAKQCAEFHGLLDHCNTLSDIPVVVGKNTHKIKKNSYACSRIEEACIEVNRGVDYISGETPVDVNWVMGQMINHGPRRLLTVRGIPDPGCLTSLNIMSEKLLSGHLVSPLPQKSCVKVPSFWAALKQISDDVNEFHKKHLKENEELNLTHSQTLQSASDCAGKSKKLQEHKEQEHKDMVCTGINEIQRSPIPHKCYQPSKTKGNDLREFNLPLTIKGSQPKESFHPATRRHSSALQSPVSGLYSNLKPIQKPASISSSETSTNLASSSSSEQETDASLPSPEENVSWHSVINEMQELDGHPSAEKGWDLFTKGLKEEASSSTPTIGGRIQDIEMPRKLQQFLDNSTQGGGLQLHKNMEYLTLLRQHGQACSKLLLSSSWDTEESSEIYSRDSGIGEESFDSGKSARNRTGLGRTAKSKVYISSENKDLLVDPTCAGEVNQETSGRKIAEKMNLESGNEKQVKKKEMVPSAVSSQKSFSRGIGRGQMLSQLFLDGRFN